MPRLFAGTPLERPVTCPVCEKPLAGGECVCPRDAAGAILMPGEQLAVVNVEKRKKGKIITTISGLDPVASDLPGILKTLKNLCGAGGTIHAASSAIEVQGDHREKVAAHLKSLGYKVRTK